MSSHNASSFGTTSQQRRLPFLTKNETIQSAAFVFGFLKSLSAGV